MVQGGPRADRYKWSDFWAPTIRNGRKSISGKLRVISSHINGELWAPITGRGPTWLPTPLKGAGFWWTPTALGSGRSKHVRSQVMEDEWWDNSNTKLGERVIESNMESDFLTPCNKETHHLPSSKPSSRWWQLKYFFIFTPKIGEDLQFDSYFSNGLKPPARY